MEDPPDGDPLRLGVWKEVTRTTRSKDATNVAPGLTTSSKKLLVALLLLVVMPLLLVTKVAECPFSLPWALWHATPMMV